MLWGKSVGVYLLVMIEMLHLYYPYKVLMLEKPVVLCQAYFCHPECNGHMLLVPSRASITWGFFKRKIIEVV